MNRTAHSFVIDPRRTAILLIAGNKTGDDRWYERMVPIADELFETHLAAFQARRTDLMAQKWDTLRTRMSDESQTRVDARVHETLAAMPLAEIRKAIGLTQMQLAQTLDLGQGSISKMENAADMYISTLRRFINALGGELIITASFPGKGEIIIDRLASDDDSADARRSA